MPVPFGTPNGYQMPIPGNQQVVIPQITIPNAQSLFNFQPPVPQGSDLNRVKDLDGAKQFPMTPNSRVPLFKEDDDVMYIKQTDHNNYPISLKRYRFYEEEEPAPEAPAEYATKEDLEALLKESDDRYVSSEKMDKLMLAIQELREEITNAKQSVRSTASTTAAKRSTAE